MDENLRQLFDRAVADEPEPPAGEFAAHVVGLGRRQRRRRAALVGAAGIAVVAAAGLANLPADAPPETVPARFVGQLNPVCESPTRKAPTDISIFLRLDITDDERAALDRTLREDAAVVVVRYESRDQAYATFKAMFSDNPALVAAVKVEQMPESFRLKVHGPVKGVEGAPGVEQVIGSRCPAGVSVGTAG
ncbi:permease-like cell division protein FtsX [Asanoa sp. WMMD1127]|uniref:permease-like cell division protein FtsX n=1 Tax=Asanoa sp. WMMD1127 TaxID=3016107 RepID=UPI00241721FC|nr:permease-like cell division protein FtsX [Asanoa sp. WMMD1127]MDG4820602.1 permease-like cell division protein FtsX [Asanoa sp. WMMD1127]